MKKFIKKNWFKIVIVIVVIVIVSVSLTSKFFVHYETQQSESPLVSTPTNEPVIENTTTTQMANPASVNCIKNEGKLSIVDKPEGQVGICTFPDGTTCEEWAYFRGACQKK